jgi:sortase A
MSVRRLLGALLFGAALLATSSAASHPVALAAPDPSGAPAALPPIPVRLVIPAIRVDAAIEALGNMPDGGMDAPARWADVGWYGLGFRPGDSGGAVIAGHLDSTTSRAVFWDLGRLEIGDDVQVRNDDGSLLTFAVVDKQLYAFDNAPLDKIFGPADLPELNLVTCNGVFDWRTKNYDQRLVVYTQQVMPPL